MKSNAVHVLKLTDAQQIACARCGLSAHGSKIAQQLRTVLADFVEHGLYVARPGAGVDQRDA